MKALIDGDVLVYRCGFAGEYNFFTVYAKGDEGFGYLSSFDTAKEAREWIGDDDSLYIAKTIIPEPVQNVLHSVKLQIEYILKRTEATDYVIYISGTDNFRETAAVTRPYKGNRDPDHKPFHYESIKAYLISTWNAVEVNGMEADDALGINQDLSWATDTIICTIDKDLDMIPGFHFNFLKDELYWVDEEEAAYNFLMQLLTGDTVDNIQGVPGIGPKKAAKLLSESHSLESTLCKIGNQYAIHYDDPEAALEEHCKLLWIKRSPEEEIWRDDAGGITIIDGIRSNLNLN